MLSTYSEVALNDCTFTLNDANAGGAIYHFFGNLTVGDSVLSENTANSGCAGALYYYTDVEDEVIVSNSTICNNSAPTGIGGGIFNWTGKLLVNNCEFTGNEAGLGGGIHSAGADFNTPQFILTNSVFGKNEADDGGGISIGGPAGSIKIITNCTFADNEAENDGGGIYIGDEGTLNITNCIVWGNDANQGSQIYNYASVDPNFTDPNYSYCDIQDCYDSNSVWDSDLGTDCGGNIDEDPIFVDADNGDYHLDVNSPCIDAGDPNGDYDGQLDIDFQPRVMGEEVDMGADEFLSSCQTCAGDIVELFEIVDLDDYYALQGDLMYANYLTGSYLIVPDDPVVAFLWKACSDMDEDEDIDLDDYYALQGNLMYADYLYGEYEYECGDPNIP